MRQDARQLLERLNQRGFPYEDFTDLASEMEAWPIFRALLRDPRIARTLVPTDIAVLSPPPVVENSKISLFGGYSEVGKTLPGAGPATTVAVGDFLNGLAGADACR